MGTDRLAKAKAIIEKGEYSFNEDGSMNIHGHHVTDTNCDCLDFIIRGTTDCKHRQSFDMIRRGEVGLTPVQEEISIGEFLKIDNAYDFTFIYGEEALNKLKFRQEVIEDRNKLIWL
jgi:hypothetical protein